MKANPTKPFWGGESHDDISDKQKKVIGCTLEHEIPMQIRQIMATLDGDMTAREMTQIFTSTEGYEQIPYPEKCDEEVGQKPNVYTDGSMLNPEGFH